MCEDKFVLRGDRRTLLGLVRKVLANDKKTP